MKNTITLLGFPRIGEKRELKFALESFWKGTIGFDELETIASDLRKRHWNLQRDSGIQKVAINDFSFYDTMLDIMVTLGATPEGHRFKSCFRNQLQTSITTNFQSFSISSESF